MSADPEEAAYYLRIISFFIDVATETVLKVVYDRTDQDICNYLLSNETKEKLLKLRNDKVLTPCQYNLLSGLVPDPKKFDISLLTTLLCRTGLVPAPALGWDKRPGQLDLSLSADIFRLRNIRNSLVGHRPRAALYKSKFERLWRELEEILLRINTGIAPGTGEALIEKIKYYRNRGLDAHNEQKYLQKLEEWWENCEEISKLQEKVEELVHKCNEFALFFRDKPKKYLRYERLLFEGGQLVLSEFLKKHISTQGLDLYTLLLKKQGVLESLIANQEMSKQIFPTESTDAVLVNIDIDSWDILVLAHVIETTIEPTNMEEINMIKDARKDYADTALMALHDDERFSSYCEDLVSSIRMLASLLDEDIKIKCREQIKIYKTSSTADPTIDSTYLLGQLESHGVGIRNLSDLYRETCEKLKKSVQEMEDAGICFKNEHVLELKMVTLGESSEKKRLAEDTLETVWQAALRKSEHPEEFEAVRLEVDKILEEIQSISDVKATDIKRHCLLLSLTCFSWKGVVQIVDYFASERFEDHIAIISRELGYVQNAAIKIEGHITLESMHTILENPQSGSECDDGGLKLPIICSSPEGMREVLKLLENERTTNSINQIADGLSLQAVETISLKLLPEPNGFSGVFVETDTETISSSESNSDEAEYSDRYITKKTQGTKNSVYQEKQQEGKVLEIEDQADILIPVPLPVRKMVPELAIDKDTDQELKRELKRDVIALYRKMHTVLSIDCLTEDIELPLERLYVPPCLLRSVDTNRKNVKTPEINTLHELFYNEDEVCRNIYLTAETGMGKTAFVKWLALSWCRAHDFQALTPENSAEKDEMIFQFLFLVPVGEANNDEYNVDSMIYDCIIHQLGELKKYNRKDLKRILETEDCLIILDGIDERITKEVMIPSRTKRVKSTFLTTCTAWTFERLGLNTTQIDKHVKIGELEGTSVDTLSKNIISLFMNAPSGLAAHSFSETLSGRLSQSNWSACEEFKSMLQEKRIDHMIMSPIILLHLLYLWIFEEDAGKSLFDVYSMMINLLVTRASRKNAFARQLSKFRTRLPEATEHLNASCQLYYKLYIKLGMLAFHTLFSKDKKHHFEFDESEARKVLSSDYETEPSDVLEAGFITGILCKRNHSKYSRKYSFFHQKVHHFFAAVFITNCLPTVNIIAGQIRSMCTTVSSVFEITDVLIFLSGINPDVARTILQQILPVIENCKQNHRCTLTSGRPNLVKNIQDMMVGCVEESRNSGHGRLDLPLEDIVVDSSCESNSYMTHLKRLIKRNTDGIQSLHVETSLPRESKKEMYLFLEQVNFPKLKKLRTVGVPVLQIRHWIQYSKACRHVHLEEMSFISDPKSWTTLLGIIQQPIVEVLGLENFFITHKQLNDTAAYIKDKTNLTQVILRRIICTSHHDTCSGVVLDLSRHEQLIRIELFDVPVTEVQINTIFLEECQIGDLPDRSASLILRRLQDSPHLRNFVCCDITHGDDIRALTLVLPYLGSLVNIDLSFIDFGESVIHLSSEMTHLENLKFLYVSMSGTSLQELAETVETYSQSVVVELQKCSVKPEEELKSVKEYIGSSPKFSVLRDKKNDEFKFKTNS